MVLHVRSHMQKNFYHVRKGGNRAAFACVDVLVAVDASESVTILPASTLFSTTRPTHKEEVLLTLRRECSSFPSLPAEAFLENQIGFITLQLTLRSLQLFVVLSLLKSIEMETGATTSLFTPMEQQETYLIREHVLLQGAVTMADPEDEDWAQEVCCVKDFHGSSLLGFLSLL